MQLTAQDRREVIEDLLDIQIFSTMNILLKEKIATNKISIVDNDYRIDLAEQKIELHRNHIDALKRNNAAIIAQKLEKIVEYETASADLTEINANFSIEVATLSSLTDDQDKVSGRAAKIIEMEKTLEARIKKLRKDISFFEEHDNCPTCNQNISDDLKTMTVEKHTHKIEAVTSGLDQINVKITEVEDRLTEIETIKKSMADVQVSILKVNNSMIASQNYIKKLMADLEQKDDTLTSLTNEKINLKSMAKEIVDLVSDRSKINEDKFYHEAAGSLLKDTGIKTKIIRQYLPVINKLVNKYLTAMDFFVHFELDESFNETIKSRHRDEFSYASFSEGEKQRIDLALLFTWRTIAKMKNSASTNLLLLDEVFDSSLDANGTDYVMNLLNTISDDTNVFVISHKGDQLIDKFKSVIKFQKYQNFSRIV
jgi:DNA repair exonuclease SbcCD ATPase subunit